MGEPDNQEKAFPNFWLPHYWGRGVSCPVHQYFMTKHLKLFALLTLLLLPTAVHARPAAPAADPEAAEEALPPAAAKNPNAPRPPVLVPVCRSQYAILVDAVTGKVLWQRGSDKPRAIASTTKMLTAILLLEKGHLDDIVTAPPGVQNLPESSLHLKPGEKLTLRDLLYAMLLRSANDTAVTGAVYLDGSVSKFAVDMNRKAKEIGATHSHFVTPNGLGAPGHYSTAADLAKIACYGVNTFPMFNTIVKTPVYKIKRSMNMKDVWVKNTSRTYLAKFPGADGIKTGYIRAAGHCFVGSATRGGWRLVAVALNSPSCREDVESLLDYGFDNFHPEPVLSKGDLVGTVTVPTAAAPVAVKSAKSLFVVVSNHHLAPRWTLKVKPLAALPSAPVAAGTPLGTVTVLVGGKPSASGTVLAAREAPMKPFTALAQTGKAVGLTLAKIAGALAALALLVLGGMILYGRTIAKNARLGGDRIAPDVRRVDRSGPRPR